MKHRWNDRIQILLNTPNMFDAWGHPTKGSVEKAAEYWANVIPILGSTPTARVSVLAPFNYDETVHIEWQNQRWKIIQSPIQCPNNGFIQFKIERL